MENAMIKKSIFILILLILYCQIVLAREHEVDWYEGYYNTSLTVGELVEKSHTGNPWELIADEMDRNDWYIDGSEWDRAYVPEEIEELREKAMEREKDIEFTISSELSNDDKQYLSELHKYYKKIEFSNYFRKYKYVVCIIVGIFIAMIVLMIIFRKCFIILIGISIMLGLLFTFLPSLLQKNSRQSDIFNYLINKADTNISIRTLQENDLNNIDKYNMSHNVSKIINDYLIKVYLCVKSKSIGNDLNIYKWYLNDDREIFRNEYGSAMRNGNFIDNRFDYSLFEYTDGEAMSKEDMKYIYDNITEEDIKDFQDGVFLDKFIDRINGDIKYLSWDEFRNLKFGDFLMEVVKEVYFGDSGHYLDRDILYALRYWYIDGEESRDIELPYGIVLHYDKTSYVKKDIKEFDYSNAYFLNENIRNQENNTVYRSIRTYPYVESVDYNNKQDLFIYYYDSNDERHGFCTDIEFIDEGLFKKNQMYFHPLDILYDVKPAVVSMEFVGNK